MARKRRNRELENARFDMALSIPPHPNEKVQLRGVLRQAFIENHAVSIILANGPSLLELFEILEKGRRRALFFAVNCPDDKRWAELAEWLTWDLERFYRRAIAKLDRQDERYRRAGG